MTPFRPKGVVQGTRAVSRRAGQHKHRPAVGRGKYVKAPLLRDKVVNPRWQANALINNPGNAAALTALGVGGGYVADKKIHKANDRTKNAVAGGLIGGGSAQLIRQQAQYGAKTASDRAMSQLSTKGNYGPYREGPHKETLRQHLKETTKATKGQGERIKAAHFSDHFPKSVPSARSRQALRLLKNPKTAGAVALSGAGVGAGIGASHRINKSRATRRANALNPRESYKPTPEQIAASQQKKAAQLAESARLKEVKYNTPVGGGQHLNWRVHRAASGRSAEGVAAASLLGGGALYALHRRTSVSKADGKKTDVALGAAAGTAAGGVGYSVSGQAGKAYLKQQRAKRGTSPREQDIWAEHSRKNVTHHDGSKFVTVSRQEGKKIPNVKVRQNKWKAYTNYPKELPGWKLQRALAHQERPAALAAQFGGGAALGAAYGLHRHNKINKSARLMSDAEIRRRKNLQGHISRTTSTLGLTAVGLTGASLLASKNKGALRAVRKIPKLRNVTPHQMKETAVTTGLVSGGIGGVGGYNFASYTNAESRKRKLAPVKKGMDMGLEMGYYGEEGRPVEQPAIAPPEDLIEKAAWSPTASNFDSEASRHKRTRAYQGAALVGAGGAGAYAGHQGAKAIHAAGVLKPIVSANKKALEPLARHGGKAAAGVAAVGAAAGLHRSLRRKEQGSWQSYSKRDKVSAFGVDHTE